MNFLFDFGMATGPVLGYVHQYTLIRQQKSIGTFSIDICGILLFANILRLNFFIFNHYELSLFFQSLIMIAAQICLIHICTKYKQQKTQTTLSPSNSNKSRQYQSSSQREQKFWRWNRFSSYVYFLAAFTFSTFSLSIIFKKAESQGYGVMIGLIALLSQSLLIMPQILQNYSSKSTKGLSRILVTLNLSGDILKLIYFLVKVLFYVTKNQPFQFVLCGIIQVILDSFVVGQIVYYKSLEEEKFTKQNHSLVIEKKKSTSPQKKAQTSHQLKQIELKNMETLSPQDSLAEQINYGTNLQSQILDDLPQNMQIQNTQQNFQIFQDQKSNQQEQAEFQEKQINAKITDQLDENTVSSQKITSSG